MAEHPINPIHNVFKKYRQVNYINSYAFGNGLDADANAFITAAGLTDTTQKGAINTLVVDLKSNGLWSRMKAIYPMVGGTASAHKWNLKDARDLDAAFRLTFNGTWTHTSTGAKPTSPSFADTYLIPSTSLTTTSGSLAFYSRENLPGGYDMGAEDTGSVKTVSLVARYSNNFTYGQYGNPAGNINSSTTDSKAAFMVNRNDGTNTTLWRNGVKLKTVAESVSLTSSSIYISAIHIGIGVNFWSSKECSYASIGGGFSDAEALTYYNIIQAYNTTLGRQV